MLWSIGLSSALRVTWMGRGLFLSGCPFYPSRILSIPAEWRVTTEMWRGLDPCCASAVRRCAWTCFNGSSPHRSNAYPRDRPTSTRGAAGRFGYGPMADRNGAGATIEVALRSFGNCRDHRRVGAGSFGAKWARPSAHEWLICIPPLIGFTVWVIVSPEPRYIASSLWILSRPRCCR